MISKLADATSVNAKCDLYEDYDSNSGSTSSIAYNEVQITKFSTASSMETESTDSYPNAKSTDDCSNTEECYADSINDIKLENHPNENFQVRCLIDRFVNLDEEISAQEKRLKKLARKVRYCNYATEILNNFIDKFEYKNPEIYCGNWYKQVYILENHFNKFKSNGQSIIQLVRDELSMLLDYFELLRDRINSIEVDLPDEIINELNELNTKVSNFELSLMDMVVPIRADINASSNLIALFENTIREIVCSMKENISKSDLAAGEKLETQELLNDLLSTCLKITGDIDLLC